jgi:hypothetical protein
MNFSLSNPNSGDQPPPPKRASDHPGGESMNSQALQFLHLQHQRAIQKWVDFDLHAVFLMQEFQPADNIEKII